MSSSIIITGASSGIGRASALALAGWDGPLILSGRSSDRLQETLALLIERQGRGSVCPADLSSPKQLAALVEWAEKQAPLHGFVHAGGGAEFGTAESQPPEVWEAQIGVNLNAAYRLTHLALQGMIPRKQGHLVYINSVAGLRSFPASSAYVAAKHGLKGLADAVREDVRPHGIKVSTLYPGATASEWWQKQEGDFPLEEMLEVEAVGEAVAYILNQGGQTVVEELLLRHQQGDF